MDPIVYKLKSENTCVLWCDDVYYHSLAVYVLCSYVRFYKIVYRYKWKVINAVLHTAWWILSIVVVMFRIRWRCWFYICGFVLLAEAYFVSVSFRHTLKCYCIYCLVGRSIKLRWWLFLSFCMSFMEYLFFYTQNLVVLVQFPCFCTILGTYLSIRERFGVKLFNLCW